MKITGGENKGRILKAPRSIRPTQDKVRATIFNVLSEKVSGSTFFDLFAGSGAVGIEALSRGASKTIFVEQSKKVISVLKENLESLDYSDKARIITKDALRLFNSLTLELSNSPIIIFADPPYNEGYVEKILQNIPIIANRMLIIEHSKHEPIQVGKHYKSGDTILTFIT
ncbi:MAG: 16S rRNA (guanine(966)-N(2))-methyltransferase RsmD [Candidatus Stahlbacteria bacterium]|nr:16S rRNA (guanine(966)-N(2))-methyltransferase RsmD [Candidatus Stahlbacteria bacterium]